MLKNNKDFVCKVDEIQCWGECPYSKECFYEFKKELDSEEQTLKYMDCIPHFIKCRNLANKNKVTRTYIGTLVGIKTDSFDFSTYSFKNIYSINNKRIGDTGEFYGCKTMTYLKLEIGCRYKITSVYMPEIYVNKETVFRFKNVHGVENMDKPEKYEYSHKIHKLVKIPLD